MCFEKCTLQMLSYLPSTHTFKVLPPLKVCVGSDILSFTVNTTRDATLGGGEGGKQVLRLGVPPPSAECHHRGYSCVIQHILGCSAQRRSLGWKQRPDLPQQRVSSLRFLTGTGSSFKAALILGFTWLLSHSVAGEDLPNR